eukprot:7796840-Pyramimonas_sp.AAC.1
MMQETHDAVGILEALVRSQMYPFKLHFAALREGCGEGVAMLIPSLEQYDGEEMQPSWHPDSSTSELGPERILMMKVW